MRRALAASILSLFVLTACKKKDDAPLLPVAAAPAVEKLEFAAESEPNDDSKNPQLVSKSSEITGNFSPAAGKNDDDWYKIDLGGATRVVSAELSGVPGTDAMIEVYDADRNRLFKVNIPGDDVPERLSNVTFAGSGYLKLIHAKNPTAGGPYTLRVRLSDPKAGEEVEPNNKWVVATPIINGQPVSGFVGYPEDEDWYALDLKTAPTAAVLRVEMSGASELRGEVGVANGTNQAVFHTVRGSDLGETLNVRNMGLLAGEQTYYLVVRGAPGKGKGRTFSPSEHYTLTATFEDAGSDMEFEPNDDPPHATEMAVDGKLKSGYLSPKSDVDWFVIHQTSDQSVLMRLELFVPDRTDMALSAYRVPLRSDGTPNDTIKADDDAALLMKVNDGELREPEAIPSLLVPPGDTYIKVEGAFKNLDGKWVRDYENTREAYKLAYTVRAADDESEEREPNNVFERATEIALGDAVRGYLAPKKDVDFYKLDMGDKAGPVRISVTGILKADVSLFLLGDDGAEVLTSADKGKGETEERIEHQVGPGVVYIQVKDAGGHGFNTADAYTLTIKGP